jgi:superfamily I DNA and/or RNA helicase
MELLSLFKSYLEILRDHHESINSGRSSYGELGNIEDFGNYLIIGIKLSDRNVKFQSSERVLIEDTDAIVEHYRNGMYYFRMRPGLELSQGSKVLVSSTSDLVFLIENMLKNLDEVNSSEEYSLFVRNLYSESNNESWQVEKISKLVGNDFTESQSDVISTTLNLLNLEKGIIPVEGPGGTGKTECIAEICKQCIKLKKRVLVCSATNLAIDNVLSKLLDEDNVLRIGSDTSIERQEVKKFSLKNKLGNKFDYDSVVKDSFVIGSTIDSVGIHLKNEEFDLVIIDEASTVELPKLLIALMKSKRVLICGDTQQLSQFIEHRILKKLGVNMSEEELRTLHQSPFELISKKWASSGKTLYLLDNFRNSKQVFDFINENFYEGRMLFKSNSEFEKQKARSLGEIVNADEITWIVPHRSDLELDSRGIFNPVKFSNRYSNSYFNYGNLILIIILLKKLLKTYSPKEIGIISPFNAQVSLMREFVIRFPEYILGRKYKNELEKTKLGFYLLNSLNINTINKFQGQEREVVVFDFTSNADFLFRDHKKLNVVLGRSKKQIIMVGLPPRSPVYQKLFEVSTTFGDVELADYSLAFTMTDDDISEFKEVKDLVLSIKDSNFAPKDIEAHLKKELVNMALEKNKKDVVALRLNKNIDSIVSETLREFFSMDVIDDKTYDTLENEIDLKIKELVKQKKQGPLFGF